MQQDRTIYYWWGVRGNPLLRPLEIGFEQWGARLIEKHVLANQSNQPPKSGGVAGFYVYDRSFVLEKIRRFLILPFKGKLSREDIHQLVEEAFDFELEEYKKQQLQGKED